MTGKEYTLFCYVNCKTPDVVYLLDCHVSGTDTDPGYYLRGGALLVEGSVVHVGPQRVQGSTR